jgi:hypothetical protein
MTKDRQEGKKGLRQQPVEKPVNKIIPDSRKPNPFRVIPAPVSTYKPFEPVLPSKARQPVDKGKLKEGQQRFLCGRVAQQNIDVSAEKRWMDDWTTSRTGRVRHNDVLRASQVGRGMNDALVNDPHSHECIRETSVIGVKERQKRRFTQGSISIC